MKVTDIKYHALLRRIESVRRREKWDACISGLLLFASIAIVVIFSAVLSVLLFKLDSNSRTVLNFLLLAVILATFFLLMLKSLLLLFRKEYPTNDSIAGRIGESFPSVKDRLSNALQIFNFHQLNKEGYSLALVDRALTATDEASRDKDFMSIIDRSMLKRSIYTFSVVVLSVGLLFFLFSDKLLHSAHYLFHPSKEFAQKSVFSLNVSPGSVEVIKNESIELVAVAEGEDFPEYASLYLKNAVNGNENVLKIPAQGGNRYSHLIENIKDSTEYLFSSGTVSTEKHLISVVELPMVRNIQLHVDFPNYTGLRTVMLDENVGDVTAFKGSRVDVNILMNSNVRFASMVFSDSRQKKMTVKDNKASGRFRILSDSTYHIKLEDSSGRLNTDPIEYRVKAIIDRYPSVKIAIPGRDVDISEEMQLDMRIEAEDDFGFSKVRLVYRKLKSLMSGDDSTAYQELPIESLQKNQLSIDFKWDLRPLNLFPEDVVSYHVEVFDNDAVSGPKKAKSMSYAIRFPSMEEIYAEVQQEHEDAFEAIEGIYKQSKSLKEKVSELAQEMKKDPLLNWEEKEQLEDVAESQQQMQQTLEQLEQRLEQMVERLEKNELLSIETLEKYKELQDLMQELMTPELREALKELQKAMESIDPEQLQKAVEKLKLNQEDFLKNLEKMLSMLKRLQIEQMLDELAKKAEDLLNEQKDLMERAQNASQKEGTELSKEQKKVSEKTGELKSGIKNLKKEMSEFSDMPSDLMDASLNLMEQEKPQQNMRSASKNFQSGNMKSGQSKGKQAQSSLTELSNMLKTAKDQFLKTQKAQVAKALKSMSRDLLYLSMKQENVLKTSEGLNKNSPQVQKMAEKQQNLLSGLNRVAEKADEISNKSFFLPPTIMKSIGQSMISMNQCLTKFEERSSSGAVKHQERAMTSMNDAIKQLMQAMNDMASSSSASGMQKLMEQMKNASCQQQGINQQTMQLGMGMGQSLSLQQQAGMARLAAQQAALKKSLEQLQQEFGNRSDILGRMDNIAKEMEDVVKDLQERNVSRNTINRQRKILSRLLDAQKSIQRRDYSRKRKAETGKQYFAKNPSQLPADLGEKDKQFRQDLLKALKQGYIKDYEVLIKKYFEALSDEAIGN